MGRLDFNLSKTPDPILRTRDPELSDWIDAANYVINAGKYEFPLITTVPTARANSGEQFVYTASDGTGAFRRFYVYIGGIWCFIGFDSAGNFTGSSGGGGGFDDHIIDPDGNTLVHTNFTGGGNEDRIRTYCNGVYVMAVDTYGLQVASEYKVVFDGLGGDTYWTYSTASTYMQCYLNGTLRMEM